jgi:KDO2-lipid IV(A) lauroyltransferase
LGTALALGRWLGRFWYYVIPIRKGVALGNVRRVLGHELSRAQQRRIVRRCFENIAMSAVEVLRAPHYTEQMSIEYVQRVGYENLEEAFARGKGVIGVMAHVGNVDMAGFSQSIRGVPVHAVVRQIKSKSANAFVRRVRNRCGMQLIPSRRSKDQIREVLANRELVAMIVDQHMPKHRAIVCDFFGMLASTSPAPARFAFETGAAILPAVTFRHKDPRKHVVRLGPVMELETPSDDLEENIRHNTERLNRIIEGWIREAPEQWFWVHKRWKVHDDPRGWEIPEQLANRVSEQPG